ncbi:MAG: hypothetical protein IT569_01275 [Leptospiraceae bacterium]|nr:hypothetical protein [Leptospiraceae bacterium]
MHKKIICFAQENLHGWIDFPEKSKRLTGLLITLLPFILSGLILTDCKKNLPDKEPVMDESYYKSLQGTWDVIPSPGKKIIFHEGKKATFIAGGNPIPLLIKMDTFGMRLNFAENEKAIGYFAHSEKKDSVWMGVLEEEVVKLSKINRGNSSVLE